MKKLFFVIVIFFIVCSLYVPAFAATEEWTGATSTAWNTPTNWNSGAGPVPGNNDNVIFDTTGSNNYIIDLGGVVPLPPAEIGNIVFQSPAAAYTIGTAGSGDTISLANGGYIQINSGANNQIVAANIALDDTNPNASINNFGSGGTLTISGNIAGSTLAGVGDLTLGGTNTGANTISGIISNGTGTGNLGVIMNGGTWILSGSNTYTGGTQINSGTLQITNSSALGAGTVTNGDGVHAATLDVGTTNLTLAAGQTYTQAAAATLKLTANSSSNFGSITTTVAATVNGNVNVNVGYVPNNVSFDVINTGGAGIAGLPTVSSSSPLVTFSESSASGDLVLTSNFAGFGSFGANSNAQAAGSALDSIQNPSGDMLNVLSTLQNSSPGQVSASLNTFSPIVDNSIPQVGKRTQDQFVSTIMSHVSSGNTQTTQQDEFGMRSFNGPSAVTGQTGISTGDSYNEGDKIGLDVWAEGFGSYLHQDPQDLSNGYHATIWGAALGADAPFLDCIRLGIAGGFAQDFIRSQDNLAESDVNSYQATVYGKFTKDDIYYINTALAFAYNTYDASRQINVITSSRTAASDFNGEQYSAYVEGGYTVKAIKNIQVTPLVSFEYVYLYVPNYSETGAGDLDLQVNSQAYSFAQTGLGFKIGYPISLKDLNMLPELKFKWLYDWIGDNQQVTSAFTGGGGSFVTSGFTPDQSSYDIGAKLNIFTKYGIVFILNYDLEIQKDFYGHYGYVNVKYSF